MQTWTSIVSCLTGFVEAGVFRAARIMSSSFMGFSDIGLALGISSGISKLTKVITAIIILFNSNHFLPLCFGGGERFYSITPLTSAALHEAS